MEGIKSKVKGRKQDRLSEVGREIRSGRRQSWRERMSATPTWGEK